MIVSVIVPAYNAEPYIEQALRSLVAQSGDFRLDICVVDDGSIDATQDIVRRMMTHHRQIRMEVIDHQGVAAARNRGLEQLPETADFVTFLDADDIACPGRIDRQLRWLLANPAVDVVYGLLQLFDRLDDRTLRPARESRVATGRGLQLSVGLFRRSVIDRTGRFDESLQQAEDVDYLIRLIESRAVIHMEDEAATFYRRHESNITNDLATARKEFMRAILKSAHRRKRSGDKEPLDSSMFSDRGQLELTFSQKVSPVCKR